jgi:hypothetical protein
VRRAVRALLVLLLLGGAFFAWARLLHVGPLGPIPGGALSGEPAAALPADWSFANRERPCWPPTGHELCADGCGADLLIESRAFALPWSGRVWRFGGDVRRLPGATGAALWAYRLEDR